LLALNSGNVFVSFERAQTSPVAQIEPKRVSAPAGATVGNLVAHNKKKQTSALAEDVDIYVYDKNARLLGPGVVLSDIYEQIREEDGIIYLIYTTKPFGEESAEE